MKVLHRLNWSRGMNATSEATRCPLKRAASGPEMGCPRRGRGQ